MGIYENDLYGKLLFFRRMTENCAYFILKFEIPPIILVFSYMFNTNASFAD